MPNYELYDAISECAAADDENLAAATAALWRCVKDYIHEPVHLEDGVFHDQVPRFVGEDIETLIESEGVDLDYLEAADIRVRAAGIAAAVLARLFNPASKNPAGDLYAAIDQAELVN